MSANSDEYYSIEAPSTGMFKDQKSKFYAFAYPVESEAEVKRLLENVRNEYHDARHHCCAYRIGCDGQKWRASDDGEGEPVKKEEPWQSKTSKTPERITTAAARSSAAFYPIWQSTRQCSFSTCSAPR